MNDIEKTLIEMNRSLGGIESKLVDIGHCLFGNGQPGIVTRLSKIEHAHSTCFSAHEEERRQKEIAVSDAKSDAKQNHSFRLSAKLSFLITIISAGMTFLVELAKYFLLS